MCDSGGGGTQTTINKTDQSPWSEQQPYIKEAFQGAQDLYTNDQRQYFSGDTVVPFSGQTENALNMAEQRATNGSPLLQAGQQQVQDTLGGSYMDGNPAMDAMSQRIMNTVRPNVDSSFAGSGRYGSNMHQQALAQGVGDAMAPIMFQNYENERGRQMNAAQMAPGMAQADYADIGQLGAVGAQREGLAQAQLSDQVARHNFEQELPYDTLARYAATTSGGSYGGQGISTGTMPQQSSNPWLQGLGVLSTGVGLANGLNTLWG